MFLYSSVLFELRRENFQTSSFLGKTKLSLSHNQLIELKIPLTIPINIFSTSVFNFQKKLDIQLTHH
nr:MAG TPA: hypothetical protein [Caudoviricetes sp.]